jgi:hypothetical protein
LEISQAAVAKRRLSVENFAIALAHPRKSVFTLLDAEKIAPRTKWEYLHWQRKMGMSKEEAREALELATRIVKGRQVLEVDKNGVPVLGARQQKWL